MERSFLPSVPTQRRLPIDIVKIPSLSQPDIPAPADHQKICKPDGLNRPNHIPGEHDIGIDVAENLMTGSALRMFENCADERGSQRISCNIGNKPGPASFGGTFGSFVVAAKNDFAIGVQPAPALNCVSLSDCRLRRERFRNRKDREHLSEFARYATARSARATESTFLGSG